MKIPKKYKFNTMQEYVNSSDETVQRLVSALQSHKNGITLDSLAQVAGISRTSAVCFARAMRQVKLLYICGWEKASGRGIAAKFNLGNIPDAPRLSMVATKKSNRTYKEERLFRNQKEYEATQKIHQRMIDLQMAISPYRDEQGRTAINRQYLSWIGGTQGEKHETVFS